MTTQLTINSPKFVQFNGSKILAVTYQEKPYISIKPICDALGLDWHAQRQRIRRDAVLNEGAVIITLPSEGGKQETLCLPLGLLNGWLFGVDENRVKPETKDKLLHYKRECYEVLFNYFMPQPKPVFDKNGQGKLPFKHKPIDAKAIHECCDELFVVSGHLQLLNQQNPVSNARKKVQKALLDMIGNAIHEITKQVLPHCA
ncbi:MAG: phage antirepressor N-terminal domain-containing protein [Pseudomonadota bacterium]